MWSKNAYTNAWISALVAASVVLSLAIYYMFNNEYAPEEEGDNVYYLGLLFTLISLTFTLVELFGIDSDTLVSDENTFRTLLQNFGIALTSTIMGIVGRVMVQNWQRREFQTGSNNYKDSNSPNLPPVGASSEDLERFNRYLLGRIARDLTYGANALARFHRIVQRHASYTDDKLHNHSEELKRESSHFKDVIQSNTETFVEDLKVQTEKQIAIVGNSLEAIAKRAEVMIEQLNSMQIEYIKEMREMSRTYLNEIQSTTNKSIESLHENFDAAAKKSITLTQNISATHEKIGSSLEQLGSGLEHASIASSTFNKTTDQAVQITAVLRSDIEKLRANFIEINEVAEEMKKAFVTMAELNLQIRTGRDAEQTAASVQRIGETLNAIAMNGADATNQATKAAKLFDTLIQSIATTEEEIKRVAEALNVLANQAKEQTEKLHNRKHSSRKFWKSWR